MLRACHGPSFCFALQILVCRALCSHKHRRGALRAPALNATNYRRGDHRSSALILLIFWTDAQCAPLPVCVYVLQVRSRDVCSSNFDLSVGLNTAMLTSIGHPEWNEVLGAKQSGATKTCACAGIYDEILFNPIKIKLLKLKRLSKLLYRFLRRCAPRFCIGSLWLP